MPTESPRQSSFLINSVLGPGQNSLLGPGASLRDDLPGKPLELAAPAQGASWALFDFVELGSALSDLELTVRQTDEDGEPVTASPLWVAWADYSTLRWQWTLLPGSPDGDSLSLGSAAEALSPLGSVHIALLAHDSSTVLISGLELARDCEPVIGNFSALGKSADITLSWDPVLDSEGYRLYYADTSLPDPEYLPLTEFDDPNVGEFVHTAVFPPGNEADYGVTYSYAIELISTDSVILSCERAEAARILATPQNVRASDHLHSEAIRIRWDAVDEATSYKIYRDGNPAEIDEVPVGMNFYQDEDAVILLSGDHIYTVRAVGPEGESAMSLPATGRTATYASFAVDTSVDTESTNPEVVLLSGAPVVAGFSYVDGNPFVSISSEAEPADSGSFSSHLVDDTGDSVGQSKGLALIDGRLAQAMTYKGGDGMRYARALVELPAAITDWELTKIDDANNGSYPCLTSLSGLPACAYTADADDALVFAWASDTAPAGPDDWTRIIVDGSGAMAATQLADIGGLAALSYVRQSDDMAVSVQDLRYARATLSSPDGPEDFVSFDVDTASEVPNECSLLNLNGMPLIAYVDRSGPAPLIKLAIGLSATPASAADFELRTIYTSNNLGASIYDLNLTVCDKGMLLSFTEYLGAGSYTLRLLRSNNMPPEDELDSMMQTVLVTPEPAGGPSSCVFARDNGAAAMFFGLWVGGDMRTEMMYYYDTP